MYSSVRLTLNELISYFHCFLKIDYMDVLVQNDILTAVAALKKKNHVVLFQRWL